MRSETHLILFRFVFLFFSYYFLTQFRPQMRRSFIFKNTFFYLFFLFFTTRNFFNSSFFYLLKLKAKKNISRENKKDKFLYLLCYCIYVRLVRLPKLNCRKKIKVLDKKNGCCNLGKM